MNIGPWLFKRQDGVWFVFILAIVVILGASAVVSLDVTSNIAARRATIVGDRPESIRYPPDGKV